MTFIKQWILGVIAASMLMALADMLMPDGPVKKAGKLICAMVVLLAVIKPFAVLDLSAITVFAGNRVNQHLASQADLENTRQENLKQVIESSCGAYIVDKAKGYGVECQANVLCQRDSEGTFIPAYVTVSGQMQQQQMETIAAMVSQDFGLDIDQITFYQGGERQDATEN